MAALHLVAQHLRATRVVAGRHQLDAARMGFIEAAVGRAGARDVLQDVARLQAQPGRQCAVPARIGHRADRQGDGGQRGHPIGVVAAIDHHLQPVVERGVVAVGVEAHRLGDAAILERRQRSGLDVEDGLAQRRILGGPQGAALRQIHGEMPADAGLSLGQHLAGALVGLRGHGFHPPVPLQRDRVVADGDGLVLAMRADPEQRAVLVAAPVRVALRLRRRCCGGGRRGRLRQRPAGERQATDGQGDAARDVLPDIHDHVPLSVLPRVPRWVCAARFPPAGACAPAAKAGRRAPRRPRRRDGGSGGGCVRRCRARRHGRRC